MAKKAQATRNQVSRSSKDLELRRWAIDAALRWPVISNGGYGASSQYPASSQDADLIGRAQKILAFVKSAA